MHRKAQVRFGGGQTKKEQQCHLVGWLPTFDNISHEYLLKAIGPVPGKELIKQWLKAGYVEYGIFHTTEQGTPQGGVISPLLANIALHGMEEAIGVKYSAGGYIRGTRAIVRYADDFVCFCESKEDAEAVQSILVEWLKERGLCLSEEKTRIVHLTEGFDFLGFHVRHYPTPKTSRTGWKLLIKPSKESVQAVQRKLKDIWMKGKGSNVQGVLARLNPIIRGWANYFRTVVASAIFHKLDSWMFYRADRYAKWQHPKKPKYWRQRKYWGRLNLDRSDRWVFGDKATGGYLLKFGWFPIERHVLVKGTASPDDPSLKDYWMKRQAAQARDLTFSKQKLAKKQKGRCPECGEPLFNDEEIQVHHRLAKSLGGEDLYSNLALVHLLCHQHIHAVTERSMRDCQQFNDRELTEASGEPEREKPEENKEPCGS